MFQNENENLSIYSYEERIRRLIDIHGDGNSNIRPEKIKLEAMLLYYSINNELNKIDRLLRDEKNVKAVLTQRHEMAKESLALYDKILSIQLDDARNYFGILCAIYDSIAKYTLPSADIIVNLSKLQSDVKPDIDIKCQDQPNVIDSITDSFKKLSFSKDDDMNNSTNATKLFGELTSSIEQNRPKYLNLEKNIRDLYQTSLQQRDIIQTDITIILQNISDINIKISKVEKDYEKIKKDIDLLTEFMEKRLDIKF